MFYGLLKPGNPWDPGFIVFPGDDKAIHFLLFAIFSQLFLLAMKYEWRGNIQSRVIIVCAFATALATSTEWLQQFIPYRSTDYYDFLFDISGMLFVVIFHLMWEKRNQTLLN